MTLTGRHTCKVTAAYGDWRIHEVSMGQDVYIDLVKLVLPKEPTILTLDSVAWKGKHLPDKFTGDNCVCCQGDRYRDCDTSYPGIVVEGISNPYQLPYRLIDGKHRVQKILDSGATSAPFYLLTKREVLLYTDTTEKDLCSQP